MLLQIFQHTATDLWKVHASEMLLNKLDEFAVFFLCASDN